MVAATELYDLLGVLPTANESEIRRGYLKQAKLWHPDKNKRNPAVAEDRFKKISEAYNILSDAQLRAIYDESGLTKANNARNSADINPAETMNMMAKALFGFGKFDTVFGDVTTLPMYVIATGYVEKSLVKTPNAIQCSEEQQKEMDKKAYEEAEVLEESLVTELVIFLKQKVKMMSRGPEYQEAFIEMCHNEAEYLSDSPGGDELLGIVGYIYVQEAKQHLGRFFGVEGILSIIAEKGHNLSQQMSLFHSSIKLLGTSMKLQKEVEKEEMLKLKNQDNIAIEETAVKKEQTQDKKVVATDGGSSSEKTRVSKPTINDDRKEEKTVKQKGSSNSSNYGSSMSSENVKSDSVSENIRDGAVYVNSKPESNNVDSKNKAGSIGNVNGGDDDLKRDSGLNFNNKQNEAEVSTANKQQEYAKTLLSEGLSATWKLGKYLLEERLRKVCKRLMREETKSVAQRSERIEGVLKMGIIFENISEKKCAHNAKLEVKDECVENFGLPKFR